MSTDSRDSSRVGARLTALAAERSAVVLTLIVVAGLLPRLVLFGVAWSHPERFLQVDSLDYLALGRNFSGAVVHGTGPNAGLSVYRPPGYPAFIALVHLVSPSIRLLVILQIALTAVITILAYRVTKLLFDERAGLLAALIAAIDPVSATHSVYVLSETLFTLLLLLATWLWLEAVRVRALPLGAVSGVAYAMAAFVRPVGLYLLIVLVPLSLLFPKGPRKYRALLALVVTAGFVVPVGLWMVRNQRVTGSLLFTSNQGYNLLLNTAAGGLAYDEHLPLANVKARLRAQVDAVLQGDTNEAHRDREETRLALGIIRKHLGGTAVEGLKGAFLMLTGPGEASLDQLLSGPGRQGTPGTILLPIEVLLLAVALIGAAIGLWRALTFPSWRRSLWVPLAFIAYFLVLSAGPEAYSRFRVPIVPFIAALAGVGWSAVLTGKAIRSQRPETPAQPVTAGGPR